MTVGALTLLAAIACQGAGPRRDGDNFSVLIDTVGDTISVVSAGPGAWGDHLTLRQVFEIADSSSNPHYQLSQIGAFDLTPGAGITIYDRHSKAIRQYDSLGRYLRDIGREGDGPGEYREVAGMAIAPDGRIVVFSNRAMRIDVFDSAGKPLTRITNVQSSVDGSGKMTKAGRARIGFMKRFEAYYFIDSVGTAVDSAVLPEGAVATNTWFSPYRPEAQWDVGPDGETALSDSSRYLVTIATPGNMFLRRISRAGHTGVLVAAEERAAMERAYQANRKKFGDGYPPLGQVPSVKRAIRELFIAPDGRLWVAPHLPSQLSNDPVDTSRAAESGWKEPNAWDIFETDGRYLGRLILPKNVRWTSSRGDRVCAVSYDDNDIAVVTCWKIDVR